MTAPAPDPVDLEATLRLDFRPADTGDTDAMFSTRLASVVARAQGRPDTTADQQEAHARALLIGAQIRELLRQVEVFRREGKITVEQGISARVAQLRLDERAALASAGLSPVDVRPAVRPHSVVYHPELDG